MKHFWHLEFPIISRAIKKCVCNLCAVNIIAKILLWYRCDWCRGGAPPLPRYGGAPRPRGEPR